MSSCLSSPRWLIVKIRWIGIPVARYAHTSCNQIDQLNVLLYSYGTPVLNVLSVVFHVLMYSVLCSMYSCTQCCAPCTHVLSVVLIYSCNHAFVILMYSCTTHVLGVVLMYSCSHVILYSCNQYSCTHVLRTRYSMHTMYSCIQTDPEI